MLLEVDNQTNKRCFHKENRSNTEVMRNTNLVLKRNKNKTTINNKKKITPQHKAHKM